VVREACVIPARDAAGTLRNVVSGLRLAVSGIAVIVVDDGSMDGTRAVGLNTADELVHLPIGRGKGAALRAGIVRAREIGAKRVITVDADGQHDPAYAPALLNALDRADIAIGARSRSEGSMPPHRRIANALSSRLASLAAGVRVPDSQSGFRAFRMGALDVIEVRGEGYAYESAVLVEAMRRGLRVAWIPVPTIYGPASHFRPFVDGSRVGWTLVKCAASALVGPRGRAADMAGITT